MTPPPEGGPVLAFEASTRRAGVALAVPGGARLGRWMPAEAVQGTAGLAPAAQRLLRAAGCGVRDLAGLAVGVGPGSYTGLRSGIALARGMALADGLPLVGVVSVMAAARARLRDEPGVQDLVVLVDARRGQVYRADYRRSATGVVELAAPRLVPEDEALPGGALVVRDPIPDPYDVADLGGARLAAGGDAPDAIRPLYLKRSHAEMAVDERARAARQRRSP